MRRSPRLFLAAVLCLSLAGCDPAPLVDESTGAAEEGDVTGVVLKGPASVAAKTPVTLDASGSTLGSGVACPTVVKYFTDDTPGADITIEEAASDKGKPCKLTNAARSVTFPAGSAPGVRTQKVVVVVEGLDANFDNYAKGRAEMDVKIETAAAAVAATPAAATSTPVTGGTGTGTGTGTGGGDHHGGGHAQVGDSPKAGFVINPFPPVQGEPIHFDGRLSHDPDGTIAEYRWDLDNDGAYDDSTGPVASITPSADGPLHDINLEVIDNDGNPGYARHTGVVVAAAGHLVAEPPTVTPSAGINPNESIEFEATGVADADEVEFDRDGDWNPDQGPTPYTSPHSFFTSYPDVGTYEPSILFTDNGTGQTSRWTHVVKVEPVRRAIATAAAAKKRTFKKLTTTATMKATADLAKAGRLSFTGGELAVKDVVLRGRIRGSVAKKAAKKVPAGLRGLYRSQYVGRFSGSRISLSPSVYSLRGTGTILARPDRDSKTLICLSLKTDGGVSGPKGSTWRTIGATGKAAAFRASGGFAPLVVGVSSPKSPVSLTASAAKKRKGLSSACRALKRYLPKVKR